MPKEDFFQDLDEKKLFDVFSDVFYEDLDSWFSADICCCDECYDEFLAKWPAVYSRDTDFQCSGIDLDCFYKGSSRLQDLFTKEEFDKFINKIPCPRCGNPLCYNIWPYEFKFNLPEDFHTTLKEINNLSVKTPFLILTHPFALEVLKVVKELSAKTGSMDVQTKYYRGRRLQEDKRYINEEFKYPPREQISEGRYNHAGFPVIYLGDSVQTCFFELRKPNEGIAIAEMIINKPLKILDLIDITDDYNNILNAAAWSSLVSSPSEGQGWYKPQYVFTRFIADCALNAGFDAIKYQSVRHEKAHNIVLLDGITQWENIEIVEIKKFGNKDLNLK